MLAQRLSTVATDDWPTLEWIEREYTEARLKHFNGNKTMAARSLGISVKTLYNRLDRYEQVGAPLRVAKTVKPRAVTEWRRKRMAAEASVTAQVIEMVRTLVDAPLKTVSMTPQEWAVIEKRSRKTTSSKEDARRSFQGSAVRRHRPRAGRWQEMGL